MPENEKHKTITTLEDKAWQDMSNRLDASMPISKGLTNRERMLLLLLLFMVIFMGSYIAYNENNKLEEPEKILSSGGEYAASLNKQKDLINTQEKTSVEKEQVVVEHSEPQIRAKQRSRINNVGVQKTQKKSFRNTVKTPLPEKETNTILAAVDFESAEKATHTEEISRLMNILKIDAFSTPPLSTNRMVLPFDVMIDPVIKEKRYGLCDNSFAFSSGLISENLISYGGVEMAIDYYRPISKKLSLQSGLQLQMFNKNGFANSLALTPFLNTPGRPPNENPSRESWVEKRYDYEVENSEIINNQVGAEYITGVVDQLHYLTIPMNLMYQFRSTRFFTGINASLLMRGTNKIHDYNDRYFNTVILSNSVLEKRNYFNRVDFGIQIGFETKLWKNLYLYSKYNHGLFQIIKAESAGVSNSSFRDNYETIYQKSLDQRVDFNRYFSVGVKYVILPCN